MPDRLCVMCHYDVSLRCIMKDEADRLQLARFLSELSSMAAGEPDSQASPEAELSAEAIQVYPSIVYI